MFAKYYTAEQIATVLDVDRKRVFDWKRAGLISPVLTKGEEQYTRAALLKLAALLALKDVFGEKSGTPARILEAHSDEISAFSLRMEHLIVPGSELTINLQAPASDVELRVRLADAIRERMRQVPA